MSQFLHDAKKVEVTVAESQRKTPGFRDPGSRAVGGVGWGCDVDASFGSVLGCLLF